MERKKWVIRLIIIAINFLIFSGIVELAKWQMDKEQKNNLKKKKAEHIAALGNIYQDYLDQLAKKITQPAVDPVIVSQIRSDLLKKSANLKLYVWMSNREGDFVFGVPSTVFHRLNTYFDKNKEALLPNQQYMDRNDFLMKMVDQYEEIGGMKIDTADKIVLLENGGTIYFDNFRQVSPEDPIRLVLSSLVMNSDKQVVGELFIKVDDESFIELTKESRAFLQNHFLSFFEFLGPLSFVFLWFLMPSWVYLDAKQRDVKNVFLYVVLTVVGLLFGLIIYLISRPSSVKTFFCPKCEKELNGTKSFCPNCGFDLTHTFCSQCQYPVKHDWQFCPNCQNDLNKKKIPVQDSSSPNQE